MVLRLDVGIHANVPEEDYHADCAIDVSTSASALKTLITQSPMHAAFTHPRLNRGWVHDSATNDMNKGTILHALMLETPQSWRELDFKNFQTNEAKAAKQKAIDDGKIPVLSHQMADLVEAAEGIRNRLIEDMPEAWEALRHPETMHEATLIFRKDDVLCRSRCDALPPDKFPAVYDFKFTGRGAEPDAVQKRVVNDYLFQPILYPYGIEALRGDSPEFRFLFCEWDPPYGVSMHALAPDLADHSQGIATRKLSEALGIWKECVETGKWPGYPAYVHYVEAPGWLASRYDDEVLRRESAKEWQRRQEARRARLAEQEAGGAGTEYETIGAAKPDAGGPF